MRLHLKMMLKEPQIPKKKTLATMMTAMRKQPLKKLATIRTLTLKLKKKHLTTLRKPSHQTMKRLIVMMKILKLNPPMTRCI